MTTSRLTTESIRFFRPRWEIIGWLFAALAWLATTPASADGALDRFHKVHRPSPSPRPSSSDDDDGGGSSNSSGSSSSGGTDTLAVVAFCMIPAFTVPCLMPAHRVRAQPYSADELYIEPLGKRSNHSPAITADVKYRKRDQGAARHVEFLIGGYVAANEPGVLSHDLRVTAWIGSAVLDASWEHFYERLSNGKVDHLNAYRLHYGFNLFGPYVDGLEAYPLLGVLMLDNNEDDVIPAFDIGADIRIYPREPLAIGIRSVASVFEVGPVLLDTRAQIGLALDRVEVRAGPRVLYQGDAQGFWGPSADFSVRF